VQKSFRGQSSQTLLASIIFIEKNCSSDILHSLVSCKQTGWTKYRTFAYRVLEPGRLQDEILKRQQKRHFRDPHNTQDSTRSSRALQRTKETDDEMRACFVWCAPVKDCSISNVVGHHEWSKPFSFALQPTMVEVFE